MLARPTLKLRLTRAGDVVLCAWWALYVGILAAIVPLVIALFASQAWLAAVLCPPVFLAAALLTLAQTVLVYLEIGADGVALRRGVLRRFVSYERIRRVSLEGGGQWQGAVLRLELEGGRSLDLRIEGLSSAQVQFFVDRLHLEIAVHRAAGAAADLEVLDRKGRSVSDWRRALEGLMSRAGGYRGTPVTREALLSALDDVAATPERRIAAALLLSEEKGAMKERIVGIAGASADVELRQALLGIAVGDVDDEAVERATVRRL
jgi:hypothetical protein